ncbi:hypothetical protein GCM10022255_065090 [Dactylosporangium darangshiense]|uniref:Uncharacterized protein n=1 Tax=Dactylosporangium darangshiense TaxID=579108 RepID=A0ABP8DGL7_9ACTN
MAPNDFGQLLRDAAQRLGVAAGRAELVVAGCRRWPRLAGDVERAAADAAELLRGLLERPGDPVALWRAGDRWRVAVAAPTGDRAATFTADFVHADDHWRGPAAEAYRATLPPQHEALRETHEIAGAAAGSLHESATALVAFWAAVGTALAGLSAQLAAAVAATATPLTAPAGAAMAVAALSEAIAVVDGLTRALSAALEHARHTQQALLDRLSDPAVFPGGRWPVSAASTLSDASLSDGDASDWSLAR